MASTLVVPLQLVMLGADALFAMHSRLRQEVTGADTVPVAKCDTIFDEMFQNIFESALAEGMFRLQPPLPSVALRAWLRGVLTHPSVRMDGASHERLFRMVAAGISSQLLRATPAPSRVAGLPATKLSALASLLRDVRLREEATRIHNAVGVFYSALPPGEAARLRFAALASLADVPRPPVDALVRELLQLPSGHLAPPPQGAGRRSLGLVRVFNDAGEVRSEYTIAVAGNHAFDELAREDAAREEAALAGGGGAAANGDQAHSPLSTGETDAQDLGRVTALGGNFYAPHRVAARATMRLPPPEWWVGGGVDAVAATSSLAAATRGGGGRSSRLSSRSSAAASQRPVPSVL